MAFCTYTVLASSNNIWTKPKITIPEFNKNKIPHSSKKKKPNNRSSVLSKNHSQTNRSLEGSLKNKINPTSLMQEFDNRLRLGARSMYLEVQPQATSNLMLAVLSLRVVFSFVAPFGNMPRLGGGEEKTLLWVCWSRFWIWWSKWKAHFELKIFDFEPRLQRPLLRLMIIYMFIIHRSANYF